MTKQKKQKTKQPRSGGTGPILPDLLPVQYNQSTLNDTAGQNNEFWAALFRNNPNAFSGSSHTPAPVEEPELKVVEKPIGDHLPLCLDTLGETNRSVGHVDISSHILYDEGVPEEKLLPTCRQRLFGIL